MADYRPLYCSFWTDPDMEKLTPLEKLVYAMLMTCAQTTESGIYAISEKYISERTNIPAIKINEILDTLQNTYHKITYNNGTIFIHAFMKRNFKGNPEMLMRSILKSFDNNPSKLCWTKFLEIYKNHCIFNKIKAKLDTLQSVGDTSLNMTMTLSIDNDSEIKGKEDTKQEGVSKCEGVQGRNLFERQKHAKRSILPFVPPTFEEFEKYCAENQHKNIASRAFKGYSEANPPWSDTQGNEIRSWKQKLQNVWFKNDNVDPTITEKKAIPNGFVVPAPVYCKIKPEEQKNG
jgi:hypothetical protein